MKIPPELFKLARRFRRAKQIDIANAFGVTRQAVQSWEKNGVPEDRIVPFVTWVLTDSPQLPKKTENPSGKGQSGGGLDDRSY